jgi:D-alanyl-D-alanine carboxypeptidase
MLRRTVLGALAAALLVTPAATGPALAAPQPTARDATGALLQQLLDAMHAAGMPGVLAQVRDGSRTWNLAAGVADLDTGRPVRPHFLHRVGSIEKTFVAATILQLVGEHRVNLDAPIGRYLPDVLPGPLSRQVTVRMLLNHTSGLADYEDVLLSSYQAIEQLQFRTLTPRELIAIGLSQPATNAPGEGWSYSNTGYIIAGLLIERLTGRPYAQEISRRILRPLGLRHTSFPGTNPYIRGPHMAAYVPWPDGTLRDFSVFNMSWAWAAGEMISTAADLNRFYRALLTGRLLSPTLLAQMQTTVAVDPSAPEAAGYGLGIAWLATPCGQFWGHGGGVLGHTTNSYHSADGRRQVTQAENLSHYATPGEVHPIDPARDAFLSTAVCGPLATTGAAAAAPSLTSGSARLHDHKGRPAHSGTSAPTQGD